MAEWPLVTVAVLAYNRREPLDITLTKIAEELDYPADRLETIVVDNASTDGTGAMLAERHPSVRVITNERNVGVSGWNPAFAAGRGDYFLALDDDCYITGSGLKQAIRRAQEEDADLVSFGVASSFDPGFRFDLEYQVGLLSFWGCAALMSRRAIDELGGYDPDIFLWTNEAEFTLRLLDRGLRHLYLPEIVAVHMKEPFDGSGQNRFARETNLRHTAYVATKHLGGWDAVVVLGRMLRRAVAGGVRTRDAHTSAAALAAGAVRGLRRRSPVRPQVSRLYRENYIEYKDPQLLARLPELWALRADPEASKARFVEHQRAYCEARPALFPHESRSLRV